MSAIKRTIRMRVCALPACPVRFESPHNIAGVPAKYHSAACHRASKTPPPSKPRARLVTQPSKTKPRAISPASPEQRAKRDARVSVVSGATVGLEPAHLAARGRGGCDDPLCVVPLTHDEHRAFDDGRLDILGALLENGCVAELAHAVTHYGGNLPALLQRLTGVRWAPVDTTEDAA